MKPTKKFTKIPHIIPFINEWKEVDKDDEIVDNFYCPNCFSNWLMLRKSDGNIPFENRAFHCCKCQVYNSCSALLEELPSNWEMEQKKALRQKELEEEQEELQDEIDELEEQKQDIGKTRMTI